MNATLNDLVGARLRTEQKLTTGTSVRHRCGVDRVYKAGWGRYDAADRNIPGATDTTEIP